MTILITGGAGFIGSNFALDWLASTDEPLVNLDLLTYAGNLQNLRTILADNRHIFVQGDICDGSLVASLLAQHRPRAVLHFAAESHVDRSIRGPGSFIQTNIVGTFELLEAVRHYWERQDAGPRAGFRYLHVSTDEVYGSLSADEPAFAETRGYEPNSPYSASKAASDHLVRAWARSFGLPTLTTNCSNNYGPHQFPEKLIPLVILNALSGKPIPVYGDGMQIRDWLHVSDHCSALRKVLECGERGATYNIGGQSEKANIEVVGSICDLLDELRPSTSPRRKLITYVTDRPGHDRRYAIDARKIDQTLGWRPSLTFEGGLRSTVQWYLDNPGWLDAVVSGEYRKWVELNYGNGVKA
jgi:dTDP-glucose 4,6-dehydratase